jgi:hypothetical protein
MSVLFSSLLVGVNSFAPKKIQAELNKVKSSTTKQLKTTSKSILGSFFNSHVNNPTRYLGIEGAAYSNGLGVGIFYFKPMLKKNTRIYALHISEIKHAKEEKLKPQLYEIKGKGKPLPFIYGKQNSLYTLSLSYGVSRTLIPALLSPSIDLSMFIQGGFSLGILKPYYLKLNTADTLNQFQIEPHAYTSPYHYYFLDTKRIYSRSSFGTGLTESKLIPGIHLSGALLLNLNPHQVWFKSIAIGSYIQCFTSAIPILIDAKPQFIHPSFFIKLMLAKGW